MNAHWTQHTRYAALDWASDHHDVVVVDHSGAIAAEFRFAHTADVWADCSRKKSPWARACSARKREEGHGHASALRCLGKRWLKILWRL